MNTINQIIPELSPNGVTPLWTKADLGPDGSHLPDWTREGVAAFREKITDPKFPCFFAGSADRKGTVIYTFAESLHRDIDLSHSKRAIEEFLDRLKGLPEKEADMTVLVLLIKPSRERRKVEDDAQDAFAFLSRLRYIDQTPWPEDVPTDLDDPRWSYALAGQALFVNISSPAHLARRSRNVGPCLAFIISPRDVFDRVAGPDEAGQRKRTIIREKTTAYDDLSFFPLTAVSYGQGKIGAERAQYFISPNNEHPINFEWMPPDQPTGCPHRRNHRKVSSAALLVLTCFAFLRGLGRLVAARRR